MTQKPKAWRWRPSIQRATSSRNRLLLTHSRIDFPFHLNRHGCVQQGGIRMLDIRLLTHGFHPRLAHDHGQLTWHPRPATHRGFRMLSIHGNSGISRGRNQPIPPCLIGGGSVELVQHVHHVGRGSSWQHHAGFKVVMGRGRRSLDGMHDRGSTPAQTCRQPPRSFDGTWVGSVREGLPQPIFTRNGHFRCLSATHARAMSNAIPLSPIKVAASHTWARAARPAMARSATPPATINHPTIRLAWANVTGCLAGSSRPCPSQSGRPHGWGNTPSTRATPGLPCR